jgi:hypothetical protein
MPFNPAALSQAATAPGYDEPPPAGHDYESQLVSVEMFESKAGEEFLRVKWRVLAGQHRDHEWSHVQSLEELDRNGEPNGALVITARVLDSIGVDVDSITSRSDLRRELDKYEGGSYLVEIKQNGRYVNTMPKHKLDHVQATMTTTPTTRDPGVEYRGDAGQPAYGQQRASSNAIYQGDEPQQRDERAMSMSTQDVRRDPVRTGESDVPGANGGEFVHPPQRGDIDPETGEPIPF